MDIGNRESCATLTVGIRQDTAQARELFCLQGQTVWNKPDNIYRDKTLQMLFPSTEPAMALPSPWLVLSGLSPQPWLLTTCHHLKKHTNCFEGICSTGVRALQSPQNMTTNKQLKDLQSYQLQKRSLREVSSLRTYTRE